MYRLLLLLSLLFFTGCAQQTRGLAPQQTYATSTNAPAYSLEALDARYRQGL